MIKEEDDPAAEKKPEPPRRRSTASTMPEPFIPPDLTSPLPALPNLSVILADLMEETATSATSSSFSSSEPFPLGSGDEFPGGGGDAGLGLDFDKLDDGLAGVLQDLSNLDARLAAEEAKVGDACAGAEDTFRLTLTALGTNMELATAQHEGMGERYQRVGWRARQMGGELAAAEAQRLRSVG